MSLLAGKVVDRDGAPLLATHATKPAQRKHNTAAGPDGGTRRYRYYVSRALHHKECDTGLRIPAREIETLVLNRIATMFDDPIELIATAWLDVPAERYGDLYLRCQELAAQLRQRKPGALTMLGIVQVHDARIEVTCGTGAIAAALDVAIDPEAPDTITLTDHVRLTRSGRAIRMVRHDGEAVTASADRSLVKAVLQARRWWDELRQGGVDITRLAQRESISPAYVTRIVRLAFLSPRVVEAILAGRQRADVTAKTLTLDALPAASWKEQAVAMLPLVRAGR